MAATTETSLPERYKGWYKEDLTEVNGPIRKIFEVHSKIPSGKIVEHVNKIRRQGFATNPYPCIGFYGFLNLTLLTHPRYEMMLEKLKLPDATYLDLACCFGQDLRQLVLDGVPSERLAGLDLEAPLIKTGFDLFLDREILRSEFVVADVFKGASQGTVWTDLEKRGFDVIHCSAFFHLFTLEEQIAAAKNIVKLVKPGGMIVGRQMGTTEPGNVTAIKEGSFSYRHDVKTFDDMWRQVGEATQTRWKVEGNMDMVGINRQNSLIDANSRRLLFAVIRVA